MTTDTIPTLAHAVRIGSDLSLYRERERAERVISHAAGGVLVELVDRRDYERERQRRLAAEMAARIARDDASRELRARKALAEVDRLLGSDDRATEMRGVIEAVLEGDRLPVYAELEQMTAERDRLAARAQELTLYAAGVEAERDELVRQNADLATRLADIGLQEPVAWIEHELQGTGLRHLHFERRTHTLRDDVVAPVWTELIARPDAAAAPVLEVRACGCSQAKAGRCVMGDYGALPIGTQLYAGAAPERAEPQPRLICSSNGLLGATSGVGRECDYWAGGVCTSPVSCQHQQPVKPCRTFGPDGCSDSTSCPRGER